MTGDFLLGVVAGVGGCVVLIILGSLVGRFIGAGARRDPREEPCSDL